ncbi:MAG TPA: hypothetical protein VLJ39_09270 [Tepidisphaeraceae bacterium]|nr:hypothetical protein [Tepidisphaeraceae bacterium]
MSRRLLPFACVTAGIFASVFLFAGRAAASGEGLKHETFDHDPGWEGKNNRVKPTNRPAVVQDFGFSQTHFASATDGEIGGRVARASELAYYAKDIGKRTLDEPLSASGTFALTESTASGGLFFGFFRAEQVGGGGRPVGSLGIDMDGEKHGARIAVRLITAKNQSCGTFATPFIPGHYRPTPIRNDGTRYAWTLAYDPQANGGNGRFTFSLRSDAHSPDELSGQAGLSSAYKDEALRRFPHTTEFAVDLPAGFKQQGTVFDHFGLMNMMKAGGHMKIYFGGLTCLGHAEDLGKDPGWAAAGNRSSYQAKDVGGAHDFGFSDTNIAGGAAAGEVGGTFWRNDWWGWYGDRVGHLTLANRLEAHGRVKLVVGAPDSDMCFGWFHPGDTDAAPDKAGPFVGVHIGGPTRVGHYFLPACTIDPENRRVPKHGPLLQLGKSQEWSLVYDPAANGGSGALTATLDGESAVLDLPSRHAGPRSDAVLDHFGVFSTGPGGQIVKIYFDDLQYTTAIGGPESPSRPK